MGPDLPIAVALAPHAYVTSATCDPAQMLVSYTIHPHVEMRSTGRCTAKILQRMMSGDATPQTLRAHSLMFEEANGWRTDMRPMIKL